MYRSEEIRLHLLTFGLIAAIFVIDYVTPRRMAECMFYVEQAYR